jgi:hypothetical protein
MLKYRITFLVVSGSLRRDTVNDLWRYAAVCGVQNVMRP